MRKTPAVLTIATLAALGLVGCAPAQPGSGCEREADSDPATMELVEVSGAADAMPEVDMYTPLNASASAYEDVTVGEGTTITDLSQPGFLDIALFDGATGDPLIATAYDGNHSAIAPLSGWTDQFPGLADALQCATEGSRVAVVLAPDDISEQTRTTYGFPDSTIVAVLDIRTVYPSHATGAPQYSGALGMPTVVRAEDGRPGIIVPDATPPDEVVVQTLLKGDGATVAADDTAILQYTGVTWADREVFDTTWDDGVPAALGKEGVVEGFGQALEGQTVGSQVLVVVPPDAGYGDQPQGSIPPDSTLVFVIDILGIQE